MNFSFKTLSKMWTSLWVTYCSLSQLIIMLCGTQQVYWCNMYLVFINLVIAWFAKLYIGNAKWSYEMQSQARLNGMFLLPDYRVFWPWAWSVLFSLIIMEATFNRPFWSLVWPKYTNGGGARSISFPLRQFGSAICRLICVSPTWVIPQNRNAAIVVIGRQ